MISDMKIKLSIILITLFIGSQSYCQFSKKMIQQDTNCNRTVEIKEYSKILPIEVCLPKGYQVVYIYNNVDFNSDKKNDFCFAWRKINISDGDTTYISIYKQNSDSTYHIFKTFKNLRPLFFKDYSPEYHPKDSSLNELKGKYIGYGLRKLNFENDLIKVVFAADATDDFSLVYKYDDSIKNWKLTECKVITNYPDPNERDWTRVFGPTIDDFTYFYWEKEE
jgi:hypothetical protein